MAHPLFPELSTIQNAYPSFGAHYLYATFHLSIITTHFAKTAIQLRLQNEYIASCG